MKWNMEMYWRIKFPILYFLIEELNDGACGGDNGRNISRETEGGVPDPASRERGGDSVRRPDGPGAVAAPSAAP